MDKAPKWPEEFRITFLRGIAICVLLTVVLPSWEVVVSFVADFPMHVGSAADTPIGFLITVGKAPIVFLVVLKLAGFNIRRLLLLRPPSPSEIAKWLPVGLLIGLPTCLKLMFNEYALSGLDFLAVFVFEVVQYVIVAPIVEEIQYRAILFAALRNKGRVIAYAVSSVWFILSHSPSYEDLIFHGVLGIHVVGIITLLIFAFVSNYVYERTGKLSLCILIHAATNGIHYVGVIIGVLRQ